MTVLRVVYILFFREERKGLASISSADGKISWYLPFSTSCKLALARDVAVKSIKAGCFIFHDAFERTDTITHAVFDDNICFTRINNWKIRLLPKPVGRTANKSLP